MSKILETPIKIWVLSGDNQEDTLRACLELKIISTSIKSFELITSNKDELTN